MWVCVLLFLCVFLSLCVCAQVCVRVCVDFVRAPVFAYAQPTRRSTDMIKERITDIDKEGKK